MELRRATIKDLPAMKALFVDSIEKSCQEDYEPEQISAWTSSVRNEKRWEDLVREQEVVVIEEDGELLAFSSLKDSYYVDFLYVAPHHQGRGLSRQLLNLWESRARAEGKDSLESDLSKTARPAMEKMGWIYVQTNYNERGEVILINYRMIYPL